MRLGKLTGKVAGEVIARRYLNPQWEDTPETGEDNVPVDEQGEEEA